MKTSVETVVVVALVLVLASLSTKANGDGDLPPAIRKSWRVVGEDICSSYDASGLNEDGVGTARFCIGTSCEDLSATGFSVPEDNWYCIKNSNGVSFLVNVDSMKGNANIVVADDDEPEPDCTTPTDPSTVEEGDPCGAERMFMAMGIFGMLSFWILSAMKATSFAQ